MSGTLREGRKPGTWELRVSLGADPLTGKYRQLSRTFVGGRRDAQRELARLVSETGPGARVTGGNATVSDLLAQWLDAVDDRLSPTTMKNYRGYSERYLAPGLGSKLVRNVSTREIDALYQALTRRQKLSARTVRQVHAILRGALAQAVRWGWITVNPAVMASPPPVRKAEIHPPSTATALAVLAEAQVFDPEYGVFLRIAAATGARRGELCALRWTDLDLEAQSMVIARNLIELAGGGWLEKDTKTHQVRRITLDKTSVELLRQHRELVEERTADCVSVADDAFVFSASIDGSVPWLPNHQTQRFRTVCRRAGVTDVRLHDLRHMHATQLLGANIDVRTVAGRLGHANAATTLGVYAHFLDARDREAAKVIGGLLDA